MQFPKHFDVCVVYSGSNFDAFQQTLGECPVQVDRYLFFGKKAALHSKLQDPWFLKVSSFCELENEIL